MRDLHKLGRSLRPFIGKSGGNTMRPNMRLLRTANSLTRIKPLEFLLGVCSSSVHIRQRERSLASQHGHSQSVLLQTGHVNRCGVLHSGKGVRLDA